MGGDLLLEELGDDFGLATQFGQFSQGQGFAGIVTHSGDLLANPLPRAKHKLY
jgi:hypothetical protein